MADGGRTFEEMANQAGQNYQGGGGGVAADHLKQLIERIERLEEDKAAVAEDIKEVYAEAKGEGFDTKVMRQIVRLRKMNHADRQEMEAILRLYLEALGEG